jgi:uncharacterized protein
MAARELSKGDLRRALVTYHLRPTTLPEAFVRLRSVQYDPLRPAGCNHDLVLQARVPDYREGDWQRVAYPEQGERLVYDGWDKQACLIPFTGWPLRRIYHEWSQGWLIRIDEDEHPGAVDTVLRELREKGPLSPRDFDFQQRRDDWEGSWYGPSVTKRILRALWHTGRVLTHSRRHGQHVYDLAERIVPQAFLGAAPLTRDETITQLVLERYRAVGWLRPTAAQEVWSMRTSSAERRAAVRALVDRDDLVEVEVEGWAGHATPELLECLGASWTPSHATILAPLDQLLWDRKAVAHLFGFDYLWEVYKPEPQRKWGYYVLPVLVGDRFVARFDPWCRDGVLEIKRWHWEPGEPSTPETLEAVRQGLRRFLDYCGAGELRWVGSPAFA